MSTYDPTSTEGLAEHASERLKMNAGGLFTSDPTRPPAAIQGWRPSRCVKRPIWLFRQRYRCSGRRSGRQSIVQKDLIPTTASPQKSRTPRR